MEVHFGFGAASEAAHHKLSKKDQLQREVGIFEQLASRFAVTGTNIETNADGWQPSQSCPKQQCEEPLVHTAGGVPVNQFAISFVNHASLEHQIPGPAEVTEAQHNLAQENAEDEVEQGSEHLRALAMELWSAKGSPQLARRHCGIGAIALGAASCAVAMARLGQLREAYLYLTMTEVHVADLMSRVACAHGALLQIPQLWEILGYVEDEIQAASPFGHGKPCTLSFCPNGGSPNHETCQCEQLGPAQVPRLSHRICMVSTDPGDDRQVPATPVIKPRCDSAELLQFGLPDDFLLPPPATEMELDGSWGKTGGYQVPISGVAASFAGAAKLAPGQTISTNAGNGERCLIFQLPKP
ncbi:XYL1 [Symbiodinium pilosum]|uniref:XYL1 protein n=1 Tax=Symbiodinium pilosum TaxID=2952 RepID=A0A812VAK5_SYMPI|nr:XYL1 [Symbiodinium pilosum]